jgi:hypothetical protein
MSLLDLLFGGANAPAQADHSWTTDPDGYLTPVNNNQNTPAPAAPVAPATPQGSQAQPPIVVNGPMRDQWQPHKRSTLGTVADFALAALGLPIFPFGHKNKNQNVQEALSGYEANPVQAIHRLAQVKGEEGNAVKLAQDYDEGEAKKDNYARMNEALDFQKQKDTEAKIANMMYAAGQHLDSDGNISRPTWNAMRQVVSNLDANRGTHYADQIPEEPDLSAADALAGANMPAYRQAALFEQFRNHNLQHGDREEGHAIQRSHYAVTEKQGAQRVGISQQNADTGAKNAETSRRSEEKRPNQVPGAKGMVTMKNGMQLPYEDQADGSRVVYAPDGTAYRYVNVNGTFVPTHQKILPPAPDPSKKD